MGCDIHLWAETQTDGAWRLVTPEECDVEPDQMGEGEDVYRWDGAWFSDRVYSLFARLAGVRDREFVGPDVPPRGFPPDASPELTQTFHDDWDAHTPSWLTTDEIQPEALELDYTPDRWFVMAAALSALPTPTRIVFWFDN